jgi:hypothetical protein
MKLYTKLITTAACLTIGSATALAQDAIPDPNPSDRTTVGEGTPSGSLPPPRSDFDPQPPVAAPTVPTTGVTRQAGVGGTQAYGRAGVLELGGSAGFAAASNYSRFEISPSIGLFVVDNLQLSLLTAFNHFRIGEQNGMNGTSATELKALIEPSFHLPLSQVAFAFLGVGAGVNYITEGDAGFALQPRIGANFLIGRSGVLTPALNMTYSTVEALRTPAGTLLAIQTSYGMNIGYTVMW